MNREEEHIYTIHTFPYIVAVVEKSVCVCVCRKNRESTNDRNKPNHNHTFS